MKRNGSFICLILVLLCLISAGCGNSSLAQSPTRVIEISPTRINTPQVEQTRTATASPTPTAVINTSTPTAAASPKPTATQPFVLPNGRFLVTSAMGSPIYYWSIVRYYDEKNNLTNELTIERRAVEVSTSRDGRFLAYYGEGAWSGKSFSGNTGFYILDTLTGEETELNYAYCSGPAAWDNTRYRFALSCETIKVVSFVDNQWVEEGQISDSRDYGDMPAMLHPQMASPAWSPDGQRIAYILDNSMNLPGAAAGPFIVDAACITDQAACKSTKRVFNERIASNSILFWSVDGSNLFLANAGEEKILEIGAKNYKVNRTFNSDESIYHMVWSLEKDCFVFSRVTGSFGGGSVYQYCLGNDPVTLVISGGGYLVGIVDKY